MRITNMRYATEGENVAPHEPMVISSAAMSRRSLPTTSPPMAPMAPINVLQFSDLPAPVRGPITPTPHDEGNAAGEMEAGANTQVDASAEQKRATDEGNGERNDDRKSDTGAGAAAVVPMVISSAADALPSTPPGSFTPDEFTPPVVSHAMDPATAALVEAITDEVFGVTKREASLDFSFMLSCILQRLDNTQTIKGKTLPPAGSVARRELLEHVLRESISLCHGNRTENADFVERIIDGLHSTGKIIGLVRVLMEIVQVSIEPAAHGKSSRWSRKPKRPVDTGAAKKRYVQKMVGVFLPYLGLSPLETALIQANVDEAIESMIAVKYGALDTRKAVHRGCIMTLLTCLFVANAARKARRKRRA